MTLKGSQWVPIKVFKIPNRVSESSRKSPRVIALTSFKIGVNEYHVVFVEPEEILVLAALLSWPK